MDLVIWTLNSAKTLAFTLRSIDKVIPKECIGQKIMIDAHSTDATAKIGKKYGWNVIDAETVGIPNQANQALKMIKTEFFASFEHDVVLNDQWFSKVMKILQDDPLVAVAQGVRITTNPVFKTIEEICLERGVPYTSIDNNIYRTEIIKKIGGFDPKYLISCDRNLKERINETGYKWVSDKTIVSDHLRGGIRQSAKHFYELSRLDDPNNPPRIPIFIRFMFSPIRGLQISIKKDCPQAAIVYPYWRFIMLKSALEMAPTQKQNQK